MSDLTVRPACIEDAETLFSLLTLFVTSYKPDRSAFNHHFPHLIASDHAVLLVASLGGEVVGYALGCLALTLYANGPILELQELMVLPECRKQGIGGMLVDDAGTRLGSGLH